MVSKGCLRDSNGRHRFKCWVRCIEYIVKEIFRLGSPTQELDLILSLKEDPVLEWLNILGERFYSTDKFEKEFLKTGELIATSLIGLPELLSLIHI